MRLPHHPALYLIGSNLLLWGVPLAVIQFQNLSGPRQLIADLPVRPVVAAQAIPAEPPLLAMESEASPDRSAPSAAAPADSTASVSAEPSSLPQPEPVAAEQPPANLMQQLRGADGLGGPITLGSLREAPMPIAARAERLQQKRSGDPLAALPRHWRDSLRQELASGPAVSEAAVVRLPVPALKERQEVPVIVNERGEGDGLVAPRDERVRAAVESWAARQAAAKPGTVQVYVVAAEPLSEANP